jgi:hypothetical protein
MSKILSIIATWFTGIKWTPLKISIIVNIILGIIIFFLFQNPKPVEPEIIIRDVIIEIPGKDGKFDTIYLPKPYKVENSVNTELVKKYNAQKDTIAKLEMYKDAITERNYNEIYEDSTVKIDIYTKVQGKLLQQAPKYFVKPVTVVFKDTTIINYNKPPRNKILVGIEAGLPKIDNPILKGSVYFQNKKDNIITIGYDSNKTIWAGYIIRL